MSGGWAYYWIMYCIFAFLTLKGMQAPASPLRGKSLLCERCRAEHGRWMHAQDQVNAMGMAPLVALATALIWPASVMSALGRLPHYLSGHRL